LKLKQNSWSDVYKIMIHYYYYYQQLHCWENIGNFPENYHWKVSEIFWKNMNFSSKIFPPYITNNLWHKLAYKQQNKL